MRSESICRHRNARPSDANCKHPRSQPATPLNRPLRSAPDRGEGVGGGRRSRLLGTDRPQDGGALLAAPSETATSGKGRPAWKTRISNSQSFSRAISWRA